ncbi:MAG: ParB/RepB/Spo0J family partition protein [Acidobacteria bacterium]|nr:ParB/RepB/Spo0J family partition protein [Acidobacteriota bacterium]
MSKRGLPTNFKLRHDTHYVEALTNRSAGAPIGRMIPIDNLAPNPNQPRVEIGDLSELVLSIREKGVLEPLLVRPSEVGRFMIISGERRYRASLEVGLTELPCIEMDVDDRAVAEISLIENLQRKDLNCFEEADGYKALAEKFGYTHEEIAKKIGKSRTSITESLALSAIPGEIRDLCRRADISSKSTLLQVVRQPTVEDMTDFVSRIASGGLTRDEARVARKEKMGVPVKARSYVYKYAGKGRAFNLVLTFKKSKVSSDEVQAALNETLSSLTE